MRAFHAFCVSLLLFACSLPVLAELSSFSNLRVVADEQGGPGLVARVTYQCSSSPWDGGPATVSRQGNVVTITIPNSSNVVCIGLPPPPADFDIALGILPPGDYQLQMLEAPLPPATEPIVLASTNFTVDGFPPFSNLRVIPSPAAAFTPVAARLLYACANGTRDGPEIVTVQGNRITLRIPVYLETCFAGLPPPPGDMDFSLGNLPPGTYTLVVLQDVTPSNIVIPALSTSLVVQGNGVQSVPINARWTMLLMGALLIALAAVALRRRAHWSAD